MTELIVGLLVGGLIGFAAGARWVWLIVDRAFREFEDVPDAVRRDAAG